MTNTVNTKAHTDIKRLVWVEQYLAPSFRPYAYLMRLDRPIGIWLLLLPGWWSIMLSSGGLMGLSFWAFGCIILFALGAVIMRGAGCVMNDLWDRDLDRLVERTKSRPIASGQISPMRALVFLSILLFLGLLILLQFNWITIALGIATLPLIATYPLMKRITWWPQAFLGLTFNFGALMGWSAVTGEIGLSALLLYMGGVFWTIGYDTIYAHQDKEDDAMAGIKSTALYFKQHSKLWVSVFYALALICFMAAMLHGGSNPLFAILPAAYAAWTIWKWDENNPASSLSVFKSSRDFGLLMLGVLAIA